MKSGLINRSTIGPMIGDVQSCAGRYDSMELRIRSDERFRMPPPSCASIHSFLDAGCLRLAAYRIRSYRG